MMNDYLNGHSISFDPTYTTMSVTIPARARHTELNPAPRQWPGRPEWVYELSYCPADGSKINGISVKEITWTPELTAFVKSLTGGVQFAKVYEQARKACKQRNANLRAAWIRNHQDRGEEFGL